MLIYPLDQSPPKRDLKVSDPKVRDLTLSELQLAPASVLLLRFEDESLNGESVLHEIRTNQHIYVARSHFWRMTESNVPAPLASAVLSQAVDLPPPPNYDAESSISQSSASLPAPMPSTSAVPSGEKKIPKWLKLGLSTSPHRCLTQFIPLILSSREVKNS